MNGRVPRTKSPAQLIAELEQLRLHGWQDMVFVVDDNFIGNKKQAKALLRELIRWRTRTRTKMVFMTEASANVADDPELCDLMVRAGFKKVFVGFETPSTESLEECRKMQNCGRDLVETVKTLQRAGLEVMGGFIVGFDNDPTDIFKRQFEFIQRSGVVTAMVGLLTALPETRLYRRLMKEGRLETESTGNNTQATLNFRPKLDREFLVNGYRELMKELYEPRNYYQRIRTFLKHNRPKGPRLRLAWSDFQAFVKSLWLLGVWHRGRRAYWRFCANDVAQAASPAPSGHRTCHHRSSLSSRSEVAVNRGQLTRRRRTLMRRAFRWFWKTGMLSTFLAGLFAVLPIVITVGIMAWVGGLLKAWLGPESFVGKALFQMGLRFVTDPIVASVLGWVAVLLAIWFLGALLKWVGKKRIEKAFNAAVERIPLVNVLYRPVAQVVDMVQRDPADKLQGMSVVYCAFGGEGGAGFLGLLVSDQLYRFNGQACQIVYVPTSPVPMSGAVVFAAADSVHRVDMQVDDLMKICLSIGVMSSKVIPDQYMVSLDEVERPADHLDKTESTKANVHAKPAAVGALESDPQ